MTQALERGTWIDDDLCVSPLNQCIDIDIALPETSGSFFSVFAECLRTYGSY